MSKENDPKGKIELQNFVDGLSDAQIEQFKNLLMEIRHDGPEQAIEQVELANVMDGMEKVNESYFDGKAVDVAKKLLNENAVIVSTVRGKLVALKISKTAPFVREVAREDQKVAQIIQTMRKAFDAIAKELQAPAVPPGKWYTPYGRARLINVTTNDGCVWIEDCIALSGVDGEIKGKNDLAQALGIPKTGTEWNGESVENERLYILKKKDNAGTEQKEFDKS